MYDTQEKKKLSILLTSENKKDIEPLFMGLRNTLRPHSMTQWQKNHVLEQWPNIVLNNILDPETTERKGTV
jgi:hypothetical protein